MNYRRHLTIVTLLLVGTVRAFAADIWERGRLRSTRRSATQNYTYEFVVKGTDPDRKAPVDMGGAARSSRARSRATRSRS